MWVVGALVPVVVTIPDRAGFTVLSLITFVAGVGYAAARLRPRRE